MKQFYQLLDFVLLMTRDPVNENWVYGKVGKNRSGVSNISLEFDVNFAHFRFNSVRKVTNTAAPDAISNQQQANNFETIPISNKPLVTKPSNIIPKSFGGMGEIF